MCINNHQEYAISVFRKSYHCKRYDEKFILYHQSWPGYIISNNVVIWKWLFEYWSWLAKNDEWLLRKQDRCSRVDQIDWNQENIKLACNNI